MTRPHDIPNLDPHAIDAILGDVRDYSDLLATARALASHVTTDAPTAGEVRRSIHVDSVVYVIRESDPGVTGALCRLCQWLEEHRPLLTETEIDEFATQPIPSLKLKE